MYWLNDEVARERIREVRSVAGAQRLAHQAGSARRWRRVADWAAQRSARADQALSDTVAGV